MEKQSAEERNRDWQASPNPSDFLGTSLVEASCCPCGVYGRTSRRLRAALGGRDADDLPEDGCVAPDCVQFAICFPFYGCLLAKLQTTVRSFYDIEGADVSDWCAGCLCPCVTLVRNEKEILLRESQHLRLKNVIDRDSSVLEPYRPPAPMENPIDQYRPSAPMEKPVDQYRPSAPMENPIPLPNIPRSAIMTPDDIGSSLDTRILPSIAEEPSNAVDPVASVDTTVVEVHDLGQDKDLVPVHGTSTAHRLEDDIATLINPPAIDTSHELRHDTQTTHMEVPGTGHSVDQDQLELLNLTGNDSSKHDIHRDQTAPKARPVTPHELEDDAVAPPTRRGPVPHSLDEDEATSNKSTPRRPHKLRDDK
ncbi:hypothetical protein EDB80DRAFT_872594 [Ilyonectria destructans]|nr:hypothetical protein EDB80DRAFT_872594 [Ilyonectria destructans]